MVVLHAGKVFGTMVAHGRGIMPPGSGTGAEEEPEYAGWAAVEKDVSIWVHLGWMIGESSGGLNSGSAGREAKQVGKMPMTVALDAGSEYVGGLKWLFSVL